VDKTIGPCALCKQVRELRVSHIASAFIGRWIKKDAPGTLFRSLESGAIKQDTSKRPLLCSGCEELRSTWELPFRERVFVPCVEGRLTTVPREDWLKRYATSLAFLVGVVTLPSVDVGSPSRRQRVESALEAWRLYLLSPPGAEPPSPHELVIMNGKTMIPPLDFDVQRTGEYMTTSFDMTVVASAEVMGVYSLLPCMLIWSPIEPDESSGWNGTRINGDGEIRVADQMVTASLLTDLVRSRMRDIKARTAPAAPGSGATPSARP
jgi:hypothetical protein